MKTIIRKYDKGRVAILPTKGLDTDYATWLLAFANKHQWKEFKIVQTQDEFKQLGIVCKPRQWLKLLTYFESKGEVYPPNYKDDFLNYCLKVLSEEEEQVEVKEHFTKEEEEVVKKAKEIALETIIDPEEAEKDIWKKDDTNKP